MRRADLEINKLNLEFGKEVDYITVVLRNGAVMDKLYNVRAGRKLL